MGKRIACICGRKGRVQHTRMKFLRDNYLPYLDVYHEGEKPDLRKYDVVYYSHYSLAKSHPFKGTKIASVTSHKYHARELKQFDGISVNNRILLKELAKFKPALTENGVDTKFWKPLPRGWQYPPCLGWVGNKDRKAKRHRMLLDMINDTNGVLEWLTVVTSKKDKGQPFTAKQMRYYYNRIDILVVTSKSEGTPNPALEAMACGIPVLSPSVGNLADMNHVIRYEGLREFPFRAGYAFGSGERLRNEVREEMVEKWDWSIKYKAWDNFFRRWL